jgi:hypothetical protein
MPNILRSKTTACSTTACVFALSADSQENHTAIHSASTSRSAKRLRARHARCPLDYSLHALEQRHEVGRNISANLVVGLCATLDVRRVLVLAPTRDVRAIDTTHIRLEFRLRGELGAAPLDTIHLARLRFPERARVARRLALEPRSLSELRKPSNAKRTRSLPSGKTLRAASLLRALDRAATLRSHGT